MYTCKHFVHIHHRRRINLEDKARRRIGGQNPCRASCFALAFLKQTVEFSSPPCHTSCFASVFLKQMIECNHLFQKDQGKAASVARILSPNPTRRPLPCLLNQSFFYAQKEELQRRPFKYISLKIHWVMI